MRCALLACLLGPALLAQPTIATIAGTGAAGFSGDGGPATAAQLNNSVYVHLDLLGNIYVADQNNQRIRKIDPSGTITTFAGNGAAGFSGDGGPATAAQLNGPNGVCSDAQGNIYIDDTLNQRIRKVDTNGVISTFAGNGSAGTSGDGGPATQAGIWLPIRCDFDLAGNMVIAEQGGHRIRQVTPGGAISTIAGTGVRGFSGDGGPATAAQLDNPTSIVVDYRGVIYFSDQGNQRIRRIDGTGTIVTVAGNGTAAYAGENVPAVNASLNFPGGLAVDQRGTLYEAESPSARIRRITPDGQISTIAGTGAPGFSGDGGPASQAQINAPFGIDIDQAGNILIADTLNNRIRKISPVPLPGAPAFTSDQVDNSASFSPGLTPGGLVTVFGSNLSSANGIVITPESPWPASLDGVSVTINGTPARMYSLVVLGGKEQISFQVPFEVQGSSSAEVVINNNGAVSAAVQVPVLAAQPGIFIIFDGFSGAFLDATGHVISAQNPAERGGVVVMFLTGLGQVNPPVATGDPAPAIPPLAKTVLEPTVDIGGQQAQIFYSGLAPTFIGLYQINVQIPTNASVGSIDVTVTANGVTSNTARMAIR